MACKARRSHVSMTPIPFEDIEIKQAKKTLKGLEVFQ